MRSRKGNSNSRMNTNDGNMGKDKWKKAINSQANGPTTNFGKVRKQDKESEIS